MRSPYCLAYSVAALLVLAGTAGAVTIVDYEAGNIASSAALSRSVDVYSNDGLDAVRTYYYDTSTALFNTGDSQQDFYGGWHGEWNNALYDTIVDGAPGLSAGNGFGRSQWGISGGTPDPGPWGIEATLLWQKSNFQNGGDTNTVSFDSSSTLTFQNSYFGDSSYPDRGLWFVVRNGSTLYVSEFSSTSTSETELTDFNNNSTEGYRWAVWTPTSTDFGPPDTSGLTYAAVNFDDVTAVGVTYRFGRTEYHASQYFSELIVDGNVVPEPATMGLLALGGVALLRRRRASR